LEFVIGVEKFKRHVKKLKTILWVAVTKGTKTGLGIQDEHCP